MAETLTRMRAEHSVLFQKRVRLESQLACHGREVREMGAGMGRLNVELQRVNALIAANSSARQALQVRVGCQGAKYHSHRWGCT